MSLTFRSLSFLLICTSFLFPFEPVVRIKGSPYFTEKILNDMLFERKNAVSSPEDAVGVILDFYVERSFPFAVVTVDSVEVLPGAETHLFLEIHSGDYVTVSAVKFAGAEKTRHDILEYVTGIKRNSRFERTSADNAVLRLYKTGLFSNKPVWSFYRDQPHYGLNYTVKEKKYNEIMLLGGYSTEGNDGLSLITEISLENILGTMRKAEILWNRSYGVNETVRLKYREPFLFSYPLSTGVQFSQSHKKDISLIRFFSISQIYGIDLKFSLHYGFSLKTVYPDQNYYGPGNRTETSKYFLGIEHSDIYDRNGLRGDPGNRIYALITSSETDIKDSTKNKGFELLFETEHIYPLSNSFIFRARTVYEQIFLKETVPDFNRITFGGSASFRGYREDFFESDAFMLQSLELMAVDRSRKNGFIIFADLCQFNPERNNIRKPSGLSFLRSYGTGIIFEGGFGTMDVIIGIPEKEGFGKSMLHLRYSVKF